MAKSSWLQLEMADMMEVRNQARTAVDGCLTCSEESVVTP